MSVCVCVGCAGALAYMFTLEDNLPVGCPSVKESRYRTQMFGLGNSSSYLLSSIASPKHCIVHTAHTLYEFILQEARQGKRSAIGNKVMFGSFQWSLL